MNKEFRKWSVQKAIMDQVEKEDLYRWATEELETTEPPPPLPEFKKVGHGFPLQVWKYIAP